MNCREYRALIDDALDVSLKDSLEQRVKLHLDHCPACRNYYEHRRQEHVALFSAMNAAYANTHLPPNFADRVLAEIVARDVSRKRSFFVRVPRWALIAASLVVMVGFVFAATVVVDRLVSVVSNSAGDSESAVLGDSSLFPSALQHLNTSTSQHLGVSTPEGEPEMKKGKAAAVALTVAMAAAPLASANGDEYQFIISGDPIAAATEGSSSDSSATTALMSGPLVADFVHGSELEARYCTTDESNTCSLRSDKAGLIISFK